MKKNETKENSWEKTVKEWGVLCEQEGGENKIKQGNESNNFLDSFQIRAEEERENIKKIFVDASGDARKKYGFLEKTSTFFLKPFSSAQTVKNKLKNIENKVVERCVNNYLTAVQSKIENLRHKSETAEKTYEKSIELITTLKIEYINRLWFADIFEEEKQLAIKMLDEEKETLENLLEQNKFEEAKKSQGRYLITEKNVRRLERGRDNNALISVNSYNQLVSIYETYQKAKLFCSFLQKTTSFLEQTHNELVTRWNEYKKAGNMEDIVESLRLTEVLKNAEATFTKDFEKNIPLVEKAENKVLERIKSPEKMDYEDGIYKTATSVKQNVIGLFP